jgi:apolipoprotein N-acyltransferase
MAPEAPPLRRLAASIAGLQGWRRAGASVVLGIAAAGAMPPFSVVFLLPASLVGLIWLLDGARSNSRGFFDGWFWAMGFFVPSLYWIALSMFVDIAQFWWMVPFAVLGLPAYLAIYTGAATAATLATTPPHGLGRRVAFAGWWVVGEWLRGHLLTGFPWLLAGYVWSADSDVNLAMLQSASIVGIYGVSLGTVLVSALFARLGDPAPRPARYLPVAAGLALAGLAFAWGSERLAHGPDPLVPGVRVRILSTDLPHRADWDARESAKEFRGVLDLARLPGLDRVNLSVWPEGIVEAALNRDQAARQAVASAAPPGGIVLAGTLRAEGEGPQTRVWNSVMAVDAKGDVVGDYDKHHLVPFGEYVPLHQYLAFSCYEAIFPGEVVDPAARPGWLLNVTDDGWFGRSIGPEQHFAIARVRAVEEGLPLVRAANGGISGLVDPNGRRIATLRLGEPGPLDVDLPQALGKNTFYGQYNSIPLVFLVITIICAGTLPGFYFQRRHRDFKPVN